MARTKNTARILRALEIQATTSSSSSSSEGGSGSDKDRIENSAASTTAREADRDDIPYAQDTEEAGGDGDDDNKALKDVKKMMSKKAASKTDDVDVELNDGGDNSGEESDSDDEASSSEHGSFSSRGSRKHALSDCEQELYYVPPLKPYHKTWEDFDKYLKKYMRASFTVLAVSETQNVRLRNRRIASMKIHAGKPASELPLIPEQFDPFERVYICTHRWRPRDRSNGSRPLHRLKGIGCKMRFRAQFVQLTNGKWRIQIKNAFLGHCHPVNDEIYQKYPSVRHVPAKSPIMSDVELMVASGSKASKIYDYTRENSPHYVQLTDVYNMIARIKASGGRLSDEDLVAEMLVNFDLEAPGNVSAVDENASGHSAVVSIRSQHMRKLYKRFLRSCW